MSTCSKDGIWFKIKCSNIFTNTGLKILLACLLGQVIVLMGEKNNYLTLAKLSKVVFQQNDFA